MEGGLKTPLRSTQKFFGETLMGGGGGATRPSAALAPSAPACTCIGMRLPRAGQFNLARLLARKPWTPRAFHAKGIKSAETPQNAPSAKFQLILQVLPTKLQEHLGEQMPKEARRGPSLAMVNINRLGAKAG